MCVAGASKTIITEMSERRLAIAKELGADDVINTNKVDPVERVTELTSGRGPDIVFECSGNHQALQELVEMLPLHGQGVIVSAYEHTPRIDFNTVMLKSLDLQGVQGINNLFPLGVTLVEWGRVKLDALYSSIVPLEKVNEAMRALLERKEMGVLVKP